MGRVWAAAALVACLAPAAFAEETVTVQLVKSTAQAPYYIALGKGYFAAEGLKIDAGEIRSALDTVAPLATGRLDLSMGAATAGFFNAAQRGFDLRIVAALGIQGPVMATVPLARKALLDGGEIKSAKDLKGRKVAINAPGDITEVFLTMMLAKYGMTPKDVDLTPLAFAEQFVAFKNGAIDAGFLPEPLATTARLAGEAAPIEPEIGVGEGIPTTFLFYGLHFMHDRPQVAAAFMRAMIRGARDAQGAYSKDPAIAAIIAKETGLKTEAVEQSTPYVVDPNLDIAKYEAVLRREEDIDRKNGRLTYDKPLDFGAIIDATVVHQAATAVK